MSKISNNFGILLVIFTRNNTYKLRILNCDVMCCLPVFLALVSLAVAITVVYLFAFVQQKCLS